MSSDLVAARAAYEAAVSAYRAVLGAGNAEAVARFRREAHDAAAVVHLARRAEREAAGDRPFILITEEL